MARTGFRVVPKMVDANKCEFDIVLNNGEFRAIAWVVFPTDGQMNDNVHAAELIADVLRKRIRQSVY
jgi:hypothetical protein